ncbi:hypothetical protein [Chamaesiphon sp. VAR_69_metabat_338]|uniref:hypothetical protein n=1 Tax=Chamaesiphon sp. VAR_69_metabat_338 TaxID=2964704 RepID=UPI00286EA404|nr:hypothetical protein [Chamaesiphon sp. VAR_69_metabat_338]
MATGNRTQIGTIAGCSNDLILTARVGGGNYLAAWLRHRLPTVGYANELGSQRFSRSRFALQKINIIAIPSHTPVNLDIIHTSGR